MGIDAEKSAQALRDGWLGIRPVPVPLVEVHPATSAEEVDKLVAELAQPAVAGPVTVTTDRGTVTVPPTAIAKSLVLTADKTGKINPKVDEKKLRAALAGLLAKVEVEAKDATIALKAGKPTVVPGADGHRLDTAALSKDLLAVVPRPQGERGPRHLDHGQAEGHRGGRRQARRQRAGVDVHDVLPRRATREYAQPATSAGCRRSTDGTSSSRAKTFSLNSTSASGLPARGYTEGDDRSDGDLRPDRGRWRLPGGDHALQRGTFFAGLKDVEHKPHSFYFAATPRARVPRSTRRTSTSGSATTRRTGCSSRPRCSRAPLRRQGP